MIFTSPRMRWHARSPGPYISRAFSWPEVSHGLGRGWNRLYIQIRALLRIHHRRDGNAEVGDRSPEIYWIDC